MKRITYFAVSFILFICVNGCTGYKPIFSSTNSQIEIVEYSLKGNKKLGNKIYSRLSKVFRSNKNDPNVKTVHATIEVSKDKSATVKNSAGKILEYKITINTIIILKDFLTEDKILNYNTSASSSYKIQDQYSETKKNENITTENLVNKIYQDVLIKMSTIELTE